MAIDTSSWERQRRNINDSYATNTATNSYARHVSQQRGNRQVADYARQFGRAYPRMAASWGARGFSGAGTSSGVYQRAMQQYVGDYSRQRNDLLQRVADEQRQFDLADQRFAAERERALADLEMDKQRQIAMAALNIRALQPVYGR